ncbi:hypothetical protein AC579_4868 [Pseudocercospora musae]|uniref:Terpene synthase n=1 Tax=Pseudocercospora musae TaxID=113226 RepID=A0A139IKI3_9PEZI|nr:hypothetical protein AC579_4868 [Pseudocercospora musae]
MIRVLKNPNHLKKLNQDDYALCGAGTASGVSLEGSAAVPVEELREFWKEIRDLMIYVNDLYSFKNELYSGNGASLITLYLERDKNMDAVVSEIISRIEDSKARFDTKADKILSRFDMSNRIVLMRYIDSLRALVTGYHTWCLITTRYNHRPSVASDGSVIVQL